MIKRRLSDLLALRLRTYPAVALLGPRQSGKTTLAKTISRAYYDLEIDQEKLRLDLQWNEIVQSREPVILDEAQNYPEVFPRIRNAIDIQREKNGRFLILGSISPALMRQVSESLTGRLAICELSPFHLSEIPQNKADSLWLVGGFPDGGLLEKGRFPGWQRNYLDLLAMRDLPNWGLPASGPITQRFFKMIAAAHGMVWNASQIGKSMGLSYHTVNSYLDYLERAYLIRRIQPFSANIRKRLVKSPKVFWRDSGLLHSLLGVTNMDGLLAQPWVGVSWEGWVIEQVLTCLNIQGVDFEAFFLRTSDGSEIDLLLKIRGVIWAVEVKLSTAPGKSDLERLLKAADLAGAEKKIIVSRTPTEIAGKEAISTNIRGILKRLTSMKRS